MKRFHSARGRVGGVFESLPQLGVDQTLSRETLQETVAIARTPAFPIRCLLAALMACVWLSGMTPHSAAVAQSIRSQAVVNLSFDEKSGDAVDTAGAGQQSNNGSFKNGATRVASPFWAQSGRRALLLDADKKQYVEIADSPDTDRPEAVSLAFFFLNLHGSDDATARGVVAKRATAANASATNYGINYVAKSNIFQVYVNDGKGFRVAQYDFRAHIGFRRLVYLTATFEVGDAPAPDADTDRDDVLIRLFVNGEQVKPTKAVPGGQITANDAWMTDLEIAKLLNDVPLTLGSTNAESEFASGLIDEFSLFPRALQADEVARLFTEVAGTSGSELAKLEQSTPTVTQPAITQISARGLKVGEKTRLVINGRHLDPQATVTLPISGMEQTVDAKSNANRLIVDVTVPAETLPGFYPVRVQTADGVSNSLTVVIDRLPQITTQDMTAGKPLQLPLAITGLLSGSEQQRFEFEGRAGDRIVADLESRRLGATLDPVLELKSAQGTPLVIEWGQVTLDGDARVVATLPADGRYSIELHDLTYRAPGRSPYRLKLGDLQLIDTIFPPSISEGTTTEVTPIGPGLSPDLRISTELSGTGSGVGRLLALPIETGISGPAPVVARSQDVEILESAMPAGQLQSLDAVFPDGELATLAVNGRIEQAREEDRYLLNVVPGQRLNLSIQGRAINSPIDGQIMLFKHADNQLLAESVDQPGTRDPGLIFTVPADMQQVDVAVRDLHGRGGSHYLYRLRITPADQPRFTMRLLTQQLSLPSGGTNVVELQVNRTGYKGPIQLEVLGDPQISIAPSELPPGNGKTFVMLSRTAGDNDGLGLRELRIVGTSVGLSKPIRSVATLAPGIAVRGFEDVLPVSITHGAGLHIDSLEPPEALTKSMTASVAVGTTLGDQYPGHVVRLTLMTTEPTRLKNARNAREGNLPLIRSLPDQVIAAGASTGTLTIDVPADVAVSHVDCVIRADVVPHAYSNAVYATAYSRPFRLSVRSPVAVTFVPESLNIIGGQRNTIRGTVKRVAGFSKSIDINFEKLSQGYSAQKITVPADKSEFEIVLKAGLENEVRTLPRTELRVSETDGATLVNRRIQIKVTPAAPETDADAAASAE